MTFILTGLIGQPVSHSRSPRIFSYWMKKYDLMGEYRAVEVRPDQLADMVARFRDKGFRGFNVTIPHKQSIMACCADIEKTAREIGAVNAVTIRENGELFGFNTDAYGFTENLKEQSPDFDFGQGSALVLGAGGAARAVVYALKEQGVPEIRITNRTYEKAKALAEDFGAKAYPWDDRLAKSGEGIRLLVNATSLGMKGQPPLRLSLAGLPKPAHVYDLVYAPLETDFLKKAKENGNKTITGIGMLLHQARPAFKSWYGVLPDIDETMLSFVMGNKL